MKCTHDTLGNRDTSGVGGDDTEPLGMGPAPDEMRGISSEEKSPLQAAIQSELDTASWHANQVHHARDLKTQAEADREAEKKLGRRLFDIPSPIPQEWFREDSPRGNYLRRIFHMLQLPVVTPMSQITAAAGMGKTRECLQELRRLAGKVVYYYAPTHDLVNQVAEDLSAAGYTDVHPVRGRAAAGMCEIEEIDVISADIAAAGLSVQGMLCGNPENEDSELCPHFERCQYQIQRHTLSALKPSADRPLIFVLPHPYLTTWPSFLPEPDFRVVDESCWQQFVERSKLSFTDFLAISDEAPDAARRILRATATALRNGRFLLKSLRERGLTARADFKPAKSWLTRQINELTREIRESGSLDFSELHRWAAARHLVTQLSLEINFERKICHSIAYPDREFPGKKDLIGVYSRHPLGKEVPTLLLDASANDTINARIFGKLKTHKIEARRNAIIYQVRGKSFSRQSLVGENAFGKPIRQKEAERLRGEVIQFVIGRLEDHNRILVVAQLPVEHLLKDALKQYVQAGRIQLAHFNALRGSNEFEDCDAAIIVGRAQPSPGAVEALARAIFWDDPKPLLLISTYIKMSTMRRMADGSEEEEYVQRHPDPRINAILIQLREREIEQAIDRTRLIHNAEPKTVYLLTNLPIDVEITAAAKWRQLSQAGTSRIGRAILESVERVSVINVGAQDYEAAVLPFGRELGRCFPEIWRSVQSAKDSWDDGGGENGGRFQMNNLFGFAPHLLVSYRRPGQRRGPPSRALVAIRPAAAPHTVDNGQTVPDTMVGGCASTPRKSPPINPPDDLEVVAATAVGRLIEGAEIISIGRE
ncbi:MAG: hypothetical protein R3245_00245 [Kiloniellales bacterium]|nr:hypothetical protein [Kiloniellales bacterium]